KYFPGVIGRAQPLVTSFRISAGERDKSDVNRDTHVITEQVEQPVRADQRERHGQQTDRGFNHRARADVDEHEDNQEREWDHDLEPLFGGLEVFKLTCPLNVVTGRILNALTEKLRGLTHVAVDVARVDIHTNATDELAAFAYD